MTDRLNDRFKTEAEESSLLLARRGIFNVRDYGAKSNPKVNDLRAIDAAILSAYNAGGGVVELPPANSYYRIDGTVVLRSGVELRASANAELRSSEDAAIVQIVPNSRVSGGTYRNPNTGLSTETPLIHALSDSTSTYFARDEFHGIQNARIIGPANGSRGNALVMESTGEAGSGNFTAVQWFQAHRLIIDFCNKGVALESAETSGGATSFTNGNMLSNIGFDHFVYAVHLEGSGTGTAAVTGNAFSNMQMQARGTSLSGIYIVNDDCNRNVFSNIHIWDWANANGSNIGAIKSTSLSSDKQGNHFSNINGLLDTDDIDLGSNDTISPEIPAAA